MREILFRGKDCDTRKWHEGYYLFKTVDFVLRYCICVKCAGYDYEYHVWPSTVGQFTGITDKNGKKIFEGDIIKHNNTHFVVEFSANHLGFICIDRKHKARGGFANWRDGNWMKNVSSYIQIIGNIHDNPELLEAKS